MFALRLDTAINSMVQNFFRNSALPLVRRNTAMFVTVKLTMAEDFNHPSMREAAAHFMFQSNGTQVLVGSQVSERAVIPDHHNWKFEAHSGSADCLMAITRVLLTQDLCLRKQLCVTLGHPVHSTGDIFSVQFRETTDVNIAMSNRIELVFPKAA
jgi:hypothetical protein